jgi:hypothetical protein
MVKPCRQMRQIEKRVAESTDETGGFWRYGQSLTRTSILGFSEPRTMLMT